MDLNQRLVTLLENELLEKLSFCSEGFEIADMKSSICKSSWDILVKHASKLNDTLIYIKVKGVGSLTLPISEELIPSLEEMVDFAKSLSGKTDHL